MDKLLKSDVNFQRVRDGRNALPFYFDLNLSTARSVAAGTHFIANVAGDSFYADANPVDGNCVVHFQDTNLDRAAVPFYVSPGFIANVPFTQMLIENTAHPGKKIRISYGVDIDFQPGSVAQIAVSNVGGYTSVRPEAPTGTNKYSGVLASNTPQNLIAPATNVSGLIILGAGFTNMNNASNVPGSVLLAKSSAPASYTDGEALLTPQSVFSLGTMYYDAAQLPIPQYVAPGLGVYIICANGTATSSPAWVRYKAL